MDAGYGRIGGMSSSRCKCSWPRTNTTPPHGDSKARSRKEEEEEEESELNNATGQKTPPPRVVSTVYFTLDDDGDVLAARPTHLGEMRPQPGVLRHSAEQFIETFVPVQVLDTPVPQLGDQVVGLLQKIDAPALDELVIAVPKISLDRTPQRSVCRRPRRAEQLGRSAYDRFSELPSRSLTPQLRVVVIEAEGKVFKGYAQDRIQRRLAEQCTLTFQFLMVVVDGLVMEAFKVSPRDTGFNSVQWSRSR